MSKKDLWVGLDVGSTTVKIAVVDPEDKQLLHSEYIRHNAEQPKTVLSLLEKTHEIYPDANFKVAVCGSGGQTIAKQLDAYFIQEVVANSIAIKTFYDTARVAIELGGQDAKVILFRYDDASKQLVAHDMRMNGSCAGGTGAFIDQVAELLSIKTEEFGGLAAKGTNLYDISGRCGVFAKTDIQPLLNQGVAKEDIALSTFHAIAKQTIGGLAQGVELTPPIIFEGGPLTFNPRLIDVFKERLNLKDDQVIIPDKPEIIVSYGAALSIETMFADKESKYDAVKSPQALRHYTEGGRKGTSKAADKFFENEDDKNAFIKRHPLPEFQPKTFEAGTELDVYIGIDAGSTTSKFVVIDENEEVIDLFYSNNHGDPLKVIKYALVHLRDKFKEMGVKLNVKAVGSTGYGEVLFAKAFKADYHTVETVAHATAARKYAPDVSFILDIGGQDMKAINLQEGIVTGIVLNEACSAGCGSFIETYAKSLGVPVHKIARMAFKAEHPSILGSRCTVFMNSSIITEQKNGKTTEDILAGISRSIIENVFTKVVRISNLDALGSTVVVQGGTFKNDAVLRAFEQYTGRKVIRPPFPGEMGAIGIALLTKEKVQDQIKAKGSFESSFIGLGDIENFDYKKTPGLICEFCQNRCNRTVVTFNDGSQYVTGNRCERGAIVGDIDDPSIKEKLKETTKKLKSVPDMMKLQNKLLFKHYNPAIVSEEKKIKIGIPRVLEYWASMPFWKAFFTSLGYEPVISKRSSYDLFESGLHSIPSDTVCFPAKLAHGHVLDLINKKVDRIFFPMMVRVLKENASAHGTHVCTVVQGYPMIVDKSDEPMRRFNTPMDTPTFHWYDKQMKKQQLIEFFKNQYGLKRDEIKKAIIEGDKAFSQYQQELQEETKKVLAKIEENKQFAVVLAGRPYHSDDLVNHDLSTHFTTMGIPVITLDALSNLHDIDVSKVRMETTIPFHTRMMSAAMYVAEHPHLELVQIVSFGCGHDAIISDEMMRILKQKANKELLILKLDEGDAKGPLNIRIKSFVETIRVKREKQTGPVEMKELGEAFPVKFTKKDRKKTILIPNLSKAFSKVIAKVLQVEGYKTLSMPLADERAIALGKKYVHNDICYPAQINIGEALSVIERGMEEGTHSPDDLVVGLSKNCEDCRAGQYSVLARKALDEAGYPQIPIITTGQDTKNMHPGFKLSPLFQLHMLWGLTMMDGLEMMRRKILPYETNKGETQAVFDKSLDNVIFWLGKRLSKAVAAYRTAVEDFNNIACDRSVLKPRVVIVGEILLNYHPSSNSNIEQYLLDNGMEVILPSMIDFFRRESLAQEQKGHRRLLPNPWLNIFVGSLTNFAYGYVHRKISKITKDFRFADPSYDVHDLAKNVEGLIDHSYQVGEGWLMPAEIIQMFKKGANSAIILQPFGCLPNHITGRGMIKDLKKLYPHTQILALDFDPDTAVANIENRLQMMIITAKELEKNLNKEKAKKAQEAVAAK